MFTSALHFSSYTCTECASVTNKVHVPNCFIPFDNRILSYIPEPELESSLESLIFSSQNLHLYIVAAYVGTNCYNSQNIMIMFIAVWIFVIDTSNSGTL